MEQRQQKKSSISIQILLKKTCENEPNGGIKASITTEKTAMHAYLGSWTVGSTLVEALSVLNMDAEKSYSISLECERWRQEIEEQPQKKKAHLFTKPLDHTTTTTKSL